MAPLKGSSSVGSMQKSPKAMKPLFSSLRPKEKAYPNIQYVKPWIRYKIN